MQYKTPRSFLELNCMGGTLERFIAYLRGSPKPILIFMHNIHFFKVFPRLLNHDKKLSLSSNRAYRNVVDLETIGMVETERTLWGKI